MAKTGVFEKYYKEYDDWFVENEHIYQAEINAVRELIPEGKFGMEVGVGTGRFALPLGIRLGVEPSTEMAELSTARGADVHKGTAENLPFEDNIFDFVLMITTVCFVDDVLQAFREARRVLKEGGFFIVGFVDKESNFGKEYELKKQRSKFYKDATFFSAQEIADFLKESGFSNFDIRQTLLPENDGLNVKKVISGYGSGSFVVIKAFKQ